jgi:hypothetical protein
MTIQVQLVLTTLDGRGSSHQIHDTIITPDFTAVIFNSPPFRAYNHYSCIMSLKKLTLQKLIHKLSTLYLTKPVAMGGSIIRNEPATTVLLEHYPTAYEIFQQAGWLNYFHRLPAYNEQKVLQFARNLQEDHSVVEGVRIPVTEEGIAEVSGLPMNGQTYVQQKTHHWDCSAEFLLARGTYYTERKGCSA